MTAAVSMAMIAKILGTVLYFIGWRLWAHKEKQASIPYSDDVKCGVVTNTVTADKSDEPVPDTKPSVNKAVLTDADVDIAM